MLENPRAARVRAVAKLATRKARSETGLFLVEGPQAVREALRFAADRVVEIFSTDGAMDRNADVIQLARRAGVPVEHATKQVIEAIADTVTPQGIVAAMRIASPSLRDTLAAVPEPGGARLVAVLHEVRDPGNLGTIIRVADAAGADVVVLTGDSVDPFGPKVVRSTTGSLFHLPVVIGHDLAHAVRQLSDAGLEVLAADVGGEELSDAATLPSRVAWLFGNEARGLDERSVLLADRSVRLPIFGRAESLNLATAASILLYQSAFAHRNSFSAPAAQRRP